LGGVLREKQTGLVVLPGWHFWIDKNLFYRAEKDFSNPWLYFHYSIIIIKLKIE
jgi:hypothetical protein